MFEGLRDESTSHHIHGYRDSRRGLWNQVRQPQFKTPSRSRTLHRAMWQAFWGEEAGFKFPSSKYKTTGPVLSPAVLWCHCSQLCPKATEPRDPVTEGLIRAALTSDLRNDG